MRSHFEGGKAFTTGFGYCAFCLVVRAAISDITSDGLLTLCSGVFRYYYSKACDAFRRRVGAGRTEIWL